MLEDMTKDELVALARRLEINSASLADRCGELELVIRECNHQNAIMSAQKAQWESAKDTQNMTIQNLLAEKDLEIQELNETIIGLRSRIRDLQKDK